MPPEGKRVSENFKSYEEGKHRRYNLLFAVNGGAFAIAKVLVEQKPEVALGHLSLRELLPDAFGWQGKAVLVSMGILVCAGWFLAA